MVKIKLFHDENSVKKTYSIAMESLYCDIFEGSKPAVIKNA